MADRVREAWTAWKRFPVAGKIRLFGYSVLLIATIGLAVTAVFHDYLAGFWQGFLLNIGTELIGVAITVLTLNALQQRAQEDQLKRQLIREMGSSIREVAVPAVEELKARGWLEDGSLRGASLMRANLQGASLMGAVLRGASLTGAVLQGANLVGANLQGADLGEADLQGVDLWGANLQGADLEEANLQGAYLRGAELQGARYDAYTEWPEGFDPTAAGAVKMDEQAEPQADTEAQGDG
jgi:hypothetical protein